ncbi:MAG: MBL fold metallo-hydrolase [Proteobacteria bacterium]|nr:MBL fold metallo-hydrolase [Pseudomonadota bacterium]MBU1685972.1 MBL fold metallo-hydrolase [Pseudomonadota bacterium]
MRFCVLGSGSKGNATFVEGGGCTLLIDAGFSGVEVERRLRAIGYEADDLSAILVTHEHTDHVKGVQVLSRRFQIPVYISSPTLAAAGKNLARVDLLQEIKAGEHFKVNGLEIHPFSLSHDSVDPLGFRLSSGGYSLGYCTDTGFVSRVMQHWLSGCNGLVLECNHDLEMLKNGTYPPHLQQRIRSRSGHLANGEAAQFLKELVHDGLRHVVLAHLSESNNTPELALQTVQKLLEDMFDPALSGFHFQVSVAEQDVVGQVVFLER